MSLALDKRTAVQGIRAEFEKSRESRIWTDFVNALRLVSQVVFTRSSGFILEFIQNAEDAGKELLGKGEVSISVNQIRAAAFGSSFQQKPVIGSGGLSVAFAELRTAF